MLLLLKSIFNYKIMAGCHFPSQGTVLFWMSDIAGNFSQRNPPGFTGLQQNILYIHFRGEKGGGGGECLRGPVKIGLFEV